MIILKEVTQQIQIKPLLREHQSSFGPQGGAQVLLFTNDFNLGREQLAEPKDE